MNEDKQKMVYDTTQIMLPRITQIHAFKGAPENKGFRMLPH